MTERNKTQTADLLHRSDASAATTADEDGFGSNLEVSTRAVSLAGRGRRGARIAVSLPVILCDQFGGREETRTLFVMLRGAVIGTKSNVRVGHKLTMQNAKTGRNAECHVITVEPGVKEVHQVEVEFTRAQTDFWPVQFPLEDSKMEITHVPPSSGETFKPSSMSVQNSETAHRHHEQIVSLADSIAHGSNTVTSFPTQEKFTPRPGPADSVAQFRAANRAAHRREQRMKALYSIASAALLVAVVAGARSWMQHKPEGINIRIPSITKASSSTQAKEVAPVPVQSSSAPVVTAEAQTSDVPSSNPAEVMPASPEASVSAVAQAPGVETQIDVRHGPPMASARKFGQHTEEEAAEVPVALPLRVGEESTKAEQPAVLNAMVAQVPAKPAVLEPQVISRAVPAKLLYSVPAQYPGMARQIHVEGEVVLSVEVDATGNVSSVKAVSGPPVLRSAALDAVRRWRYQPASLGDKPVASTETVRVQFRLK